MYLYFMGSLFYCEFEGHVSTMWETLFVQVKIYSTNNILSDCKVLPGLKQWVLQ